MDCEGAATSLVRATPLHWRHPGRPILALVLHDRADTPQSTGVRLIMRCIEQLAIAVIALECALRSPIIPPNRGPPGPLSVQPFSSAAVVGVVSFPHSRLRIHHFGVASGEAEILPPRLVTPSGDT